MDMRFFGHVPNPLRNKNLKSPNPDILQKLVFLAPKALLYHLGTREKNIFFNIELYDLANGKGRV
jgi:hypothetical protein